MKIDAYLHMMQIREPNRSDQRSIECICKMPVLFSNDVKVTRFNSTFKYWWRTQGQQTDVPVSSFNCPSHLWTKTISHQLSVEVLYKIYYTNISIVANYAYRFAESLLLTPLRKTKIHNVNINRFMLSRFIPDSKRHRNKKKHNPIQRSCRR